MFTTKSKIWRPHRVLAAAKGTTVRICCSYPQAPQTGVTVGLTSTELHRAALLARLSGLCYKPSGQLDSKLQVEGLKLVTSGATNFTRWFVADGSLETTGRRQRLDLRRNPSETEILPTATKFSQSESNIERVIIFRGVVWQGKGIDSLGLWQDLLRFWPTPFAREYTEPAGILLAHAGVAEMANQLLDLVSVPVAEAAALQRPVTFGGHSLGGSLALLLSVLCRVHKRLSPDLLSSCSFGSPPVLSHAGGGGGDAVLKVLGLKRSRLKSFVLENDPVPRALLSVDPAFAALKQSRMGAAILSLRHSLLGPGVPLTPDRFLADNVGDVHLIKWSADSGHRVVHLAPEEMEVQFSIDGGKTAPGRLKAIFDHAHASYSVDLDAAARQLERKGL